MDSVVEIEGRTLKLTNLDKPLYPGGFTKGQVIDYYVRIAPWILPHLSGRNVTMVRFPNGVEGKNFFAKNIPSHAPEWIERVELRDNVYIVCRDLPTLVFMANLAALELHVPLHRVADHSFGPDALVFDLDPGPGTGIGECAKVAGWIRELLTPLGFTLSPKTSGSKGMQLYAVGPALPSKYEGPDGSTAFAKRVAEGLELTHPELVVSKQTKDLRHGKILIDWSQNVSAKTTICAYSLRARTDPTVSTPVTWEEVERAEATGQLRFTSDEVLERVAKVGDLFFQPGQKG
jgi:bifunctional non-homologous end joining protein LigD